MRQPKMLVIVLAVTVMLVLPGSKQQTIETPVSRKINVLTAKLVIELQAILKYLSFLFLFRLLTQSHQGDIAILVVAHREFRVFQEAQDPRDQQVLRVHPAVKDFKVPRVLPVHKGTKVNKARWEFKALLDLPGHRGFRDLRWVKTGSSACFRISIME